MSKTIDQRIEELRQFMQQNKIEAFIVPSTDPHSGEYIPEHWECRRWISGFTGSAGTIVVTMQKAGLWTDSRYFIQAEEQLKGTCISLFKDKLPQTPTIEQWLISELPTGSKVGLDPWTNGLAAITEFKEALAKKSIEIQYTSDPFSTIWNERPSIPQNKIFIHKLEFAGKSTTEKLEQIHKSMKEEGSQYMLVTALDDIAWTLNMRGNDIHCNPVFVSYLLIGLDKTILFIQSGKIDSEVAAYLKQTGIETRQYDELKAELKAIANKGEKIEVSPSINGGAFDIIKDVAIVRNSPILFIKAIKNETEIKGYKSAMLRDGVAMVKFLKWIKSAVKQSKQSELSISRKLFGFRSEQKYFMGESFDTIAGYKEHAAIVHYEPDEKSDKEIKPEGMLLLDSGGQYLDGTTDITRTIILGDVTDEEKKDFTLVLKGMIELSMVEFPYGTCGTQLDVLARLEMWRNGINYMHGTGHGVGHFLNVHEGPHQFRMNYMPALFLPGMTVTNEPGIYKEGRHGTRTENTMIIVKAQTTEFGDFFKFEPLTICPIDKEGIAIEILDEKEIEWLNNYHADTYSKLSPYLNDEEKEWLKEATSPIYK